MSWPASWRTRRRAARQQFKTRVRVRFRLHGGLVAGGEAPGEGATVYIRRGGKGRTGPLVVATTRHPVSDREQKTLSRPRIQLSTETTIQCLSQPLTRERSPSLARAAAFLATSACARAPSDAQARRTKLPCSRRYHPLRRPWLSPVRERRAASCGPRALVQHHDSPRAPPASPSPPRRAHHPRLSGAEIQILISR